eukprot:2643423-Prymnesium_polylepis.1
MVHAHTRCGGTVIVGPPAPLTCCVRCGAGVPRTAAVRRHYVTCTCVRCCEANACGRTCGHVDTSRVDLVRLAAALSSVRRASARAARCELRHAL